MGTVRTTGNASGTAFGNQRKTDRAQNGVLWSIVNPSQSTTDVFTSYSTDGGATWAAGASVNTGTVSGAGSYVPNASFFIDLDDYAHLVFKDTNDGYIRYSRGTPNAARTAYAWSATTQIEPDAALDFPDLVVHREGAGWVAHVIVSRTGSTTAKVSYYRGSISSSGTVAFGGPTSLATGLAAANSNAAYASIDFNHTGDGKTVAGGTPHLYVGWSTGATGAGYGIRFRKATYSGGSWTWGSEIEVDNAHYMVGGSGSVVPGVFDGTRFVIAGQVQAANDHDLILHDVNVTTLAVTARTLDTQLTAVNTTRAIRYGSTSYDTLSNVYIFGTSATGAPTDVAYRKWDRAAGTLGPRVSFDSTGRADPWVSARRGPQGQAIDYVYTDGTASPYTVTSGRITLNQNPIAPTPLTPADNATWDSATDQTVTFRHNDPDGDAASSWRIRYRPAGTSVPYAYLTGSTTAANGATVTAPVPANTWPGVIEYAEQTYDPSNTEGAWGPTRVVTGVPAALAALTGGGGGSSIDVDELQEKVQSDRIERTAGRQVLASVATVSPLTITLPASQGGATVAAQRHGGYTPVVNDVVEAALVTDAWVVRDKIV